MAKWTTTTLTYLHVDHLSTPIRGTHGLGGSGTLNPGEESFQDFSTPYGLNPTSGWWGNGNSGFDPATGPGSNCGVTGFTTHAKDCESGLQYMQARHYSPVVARFLSVDPVAFTDLLKPHQFNRYAYTWNNPINATDPTGMETVCNEASCKITADTYNPERSNGQTTVLSVVDGLAAAFGASVVAVETGDKEKLGYGSDGSVSEVGGATTETTATGSTVSGGIPSNADFVIHGHINSGEFESDGMVDNPVDNDGYGDTQSLSFSNPKVTVTVSNGYLGFHEIENGQLTFTTHRNAMTSAQIDKIQRNLNRSQRKFMIPTP